MTLNYEEIGKRIARIREGLGHKTARPFAQMLNVTYEAAWGYERGKSLRLETLDRIAALDPEQRGLVWLLALDGEEGTVRTPREDFVEKRRELTMKLSIAIAQGERAFAAARAAIDDAMAEPSAAQQSQLTEIALKLAHHDISAGKATLVDIEDHERPRRRSLAHQDQPSRPALKTRKRQK